MAREPNRQRKLRRKAKKSAERREKKRHAAATTQASRGAAREIDAFEEMAAHGEIDDAIELLEDLARRFPNRVDVLSRLAEAYREDGDPWRFQATCARLAAIDQHEPRWWLTLAATAIGNTQLTTAQQALAHLTAAWPTHPETAKAREALKALHEIQAAERQRFGLDEELGPSVLVLHEEVVMQLELGEYEKTCASSARLLALCPTFAPALNNRSEAHFLAGRSDAAIADSRRVLEFDPLNFHALANLTRYLYLAGDFEGAQASAAALKACDADAPDAFLKKAESFAILGDWEGVRQAVDGDRSAWSETGGTPCLADHLAGVALANLGDIKAARRHWRQAAAGFAAAADWAKDNLEDSKRPAGKRHGPWAFPLSYWLPRGALAPLAEQAGRNRGNADATQTIERLFDRHPQFELMADALLQRSDPSACQLVIRLAGWSNRPQMVVALKTFALGERGSDALRMDALMTLSQAKHLSGTVDYWRDGVLSPVMLLSQEIHFEPTADLPPRISELMATAHEFLSDGRGAEAESLLDEVLQARPDDPGAQFNRAIAIRLQGRNDESLEIVRRLHRDHPDYLFARTHLADECIAAGDLEGARELLAPIAQRTRLHASEYAAWCSANINMALARGDAKAARSLIDAWAQIDPDNEKIAIWRSRIRGRRGLLGSQSRLLSQRSEDA